ncbi:MAG: helix-hairpin-helix domain-containing protein [candidate division WOR-3 bacterium]|nr:helix-hairpin-helix domain-containing protein [candidate division WOR-3 bacterium]
MNEKGYLYLSIIIMLAALSIYIYKAEVFKPQTAAEEVISEKMSIDINNADKSELTALPGIGTALAEAIIAHRDSAGSFHKKEDIMEVSGIKQGKYSQLKDYIYVNENSED